MPVWRTVGAILDFAIRRTAGAAGWLVLPVGLLLFLQWPLRDLVHAWSVQANDLAQCLFAIFVAAAVTAATRARIHLAPAHHNRAPRLAAAAVLPWSLCLLIFGAGSVSRSVLQLESFGETGDPGYFLIKLAGWLLGLGMTGQALADLFRRGS
jgi:hypothetical protein